MISLAEVNLSAGALAAVQSVLCSGQLVQGERVASFEQALARRVGRRHAVAVSSGTSALELALAALGIGRGDEVLCPALTWPSPAHAIKNRGATPVLVDVDRRSWNASAQQLKAAISERTRAAIVIDQFGNPAEHPAILAALPDIPIVVDAACALGSEIEGRPCGSHGAIACFSFHPRKTLTTGEGGACLTDDPNLAKLLRALRNHGQQQPGDFLCASGNHRMTELAAAIGTAELELLDSRIARRRQLGAYYREALVDFRLQESLANAQPNYQTLGVLVGRAGDGGAERDRVIAELRARGVGAGRLSYALHQLPQLAAEAQLAQSAARPLNQAAEIAQLGVALPLHPAITDAQAEQVVTALRAVVEPT